MTLSSKFWLSVAIVLLLLGNYSLFFGKGFHSSNPVFVLSVNAITIVADAGLLGTLILYLFADWIPAFNAWLDRKDGDE